MRAHDLGVLVDVRSSPYSAYMKEFDYQKIQVALSGTGIHYVYLGALLGGMPKDQRLWTRGKPDYAKLRESDSYRLGLSKLKELLDAHGAVCLMCGCARAMSCHRGKLLAPDIEREFGLELWHIDMNGEAHRHEPGDAATQLELF